MRIIVVCTGNTCRSPMAQAMLSDKFTQTDVISRGLAVTWGTGVSRHSVEVMSEMGYDISTHAPKQLTREEAQQADLILTMTSGHRDRIIFMWQEIKEKVFTLCEYAGQGGDIADPFGGALEDYRECAKQIKAVIEGIAL